MTAVRWIEAFDMVQNEAGEWLWDPFIDRHERLHDDYLALQREWNRFVPEYNAMVQPRNIGRPLAASEAQVAQVRKLRKAGRSLRSIAEEMSLSVRTVRTIVEQKDGRDRTTVKHLQRIDPPQAQSVLAGSRVCPQRASQAHQRDAGPRPRASEGSQRTWEVSDSCDDR